VKKRIIGIDFIERR